MCNNLNILKDTVEVMRLASGAVNERNSELSTCHCLGWREGGGREGEGRRGGRDGEVGNI